MATLLEIASTVSRRIPLSTTISTVVGNSEPLIAQLREILQEEGEELNSKHEWARLIKTWSFSVTADPHTETHPDDYDRYMTEADFWRSGSDVTPLSGPVKSDDWHYIVDITGTYPGYWRPYTTGVQITGVPTTETVDIEYISNAWIMDENGSTEKSEWGADSDTVLLPERLFVLGARWRWKQSKGLEYGEDMETYERELERRISVDRASRPVSTRRRHKGNYDITQYSWPGSVTDT